MAKYRVTGDSWLHFEDGPRLVQPFTEVRHDDGNIEQVPTTINYEGWPNAFMVPLDDEAKENAEVLAGLRARGAQLPRSPQAWREQREREKRERQNA
jgi:hypothetical protein